MTSKINLYINSKNRNSDETVNNFKCVLHDGFLKCNNDQYFKMNVSAFSCYNTFYQLNNNSNYFQIVYRKNDGSLYMIQDYYLTSGNPNVYDLMTSINTLLINECYLTYNKVLNKYTYFRTRAQDSNYFTLYIKPITSGTFFGFTNNIENQITFGGRVSDYCINVNSITAINLTIQGDILFRNCSVDNCYSKWHNSNIILQKQVDVSKNCLIKYDNSDGGDSFNFMLSNQERIKHFVLQVFDQNMNTITDFPEYILNLQFDIIQKDKTNFYFDKIIEYLRESYLILGHLLELFLGRNNLISN